MKSPASLTLWKRRASIISKLNATVVECRVMAVVVGQSPWSNMAEYYNQISDSEVNYCSICVFYETD
jgi:hypothetical protein